MLFNRITSSGLVLTRLPNAVPMNLGSSGKSTKMSEVFTPVALAMSDLSSSIFLVSRRKRESLRRDKSSATESEQSTKARIGRTRFLKLVMAWLKSASECELLRTSCSSILRKSIALQRSSPLIDFSPFLL